MRKYDGVRFCNSNYYGYSIWVLEGKCSEGFGVRLATCNYTASSSKPPKFSLSLPACVVRSHPVETLRDLEGLRPYCTCLLSSLRSNMKVSQIRGPFLGVLTIKIIVYWVLLWGLIFMETAIFPSSQNWRFWTVHLLSNGTEPQA